MTTMFRSLDGTSLAADVVVPADARRGAVLVHGGGVNRHEGGFYDRLASGLAAAGVASLRVDLRGHGESGGAQENLTLAGVGNDVRAAVDHLAVAAGIERVSVIGASFSGGVCAMFAARHGTLVDRLILFNPLLDYKKRFVDDKSYWSKGRINPDAGEELERDGYVAHSPTFRLGVALLNEVFWWDVRAELPTISVPTLLVHGTADTFIPVQSSRSAVEAMKPLATLIELEGAQHGLAMPDDPQYEQPQTRAWQAKVVGECARWLSG